MDRTVILKIERAQNLGDARQTISNILFRAPKAEFSLSEIAILGGVSKSTASRIIRQLEGKELVQIQDSVPLTRIAATKLRTVSGVKNARGTLPDSHIQRARLPRRPKSTMCPKEGLWFLCNLPIESFAVVAEDSV